MPLYSTACPLPVSRKIFRHKGSVSPIPTTGLSLWLKADAGVSTTPEQFISQIIISGAGTTTSNGTYTRNSGGETTFDGPNGNYIYFQIYEGNNLKFSIFDVANDNSTYFLTINYVTISAIAIQGGDSPAPTASTSLSNTGNFIVTAWADQSGNGRDASPVDVNPTYNSSDLNSKPTISLSSVAGETNKSFQISGNPMGASGATAFVVNYVDPAVFPVDGEGGNANGALLGNFGDASDGSHWPYGLGGTASVYDSFATDSRKNALGLPTGITSWNIYSVYSQDNDWKIFCNGAEFYFDDANVYSNAIANSTSLYIGMQNNAGSDQIFKGKVAEVVIYSRVLTTPERQQVEAYLNAKYAIY